MTKFSYVARQKDGQVTKGFIDSPGLEMAARSLRRRNFIPIKIQPIGESFFGNIFDSIFNKISLPDLVNLTRNISTMITAGLPLTGALAILEQQAPPKLAPIVSDVLTSVQGGTSFAESLSYHPEAFSKVYVALIRSGESAGVLDDVLKKLADNLEKQREFQAKVKGAMIYPTIIITGMIGVAIIMMVAVVPKMTSLYTEFGAKMPAATQALMDISAFFVKNLPLMVILFFVGLYFFRLFQKTTAGRRKIDEFKLKIPLVGSLQQKVALADICRTLGLLVASGVQILDGLNIVAEASDNVVYTEGIKKAAKQVEKGFPLSRALMENPYFPPIVSQLLSVGEETGKVDEVLAKISHFFEVESDQTLKGLTTAIEPLIMIVLGVGVGFLIIAIILPIYSLTSQF
ncbi:MAG: putative type II secretion system protein F [Microgenomates group bacterium ADurb.Bin219]|nr:MAG: putative type II secretion system protein F [Microgenomates group bacterium ADurb.Bin219]HNP89492.1 type II secretion system F family protein [Candidatus Woesebacteria bacterium]